MAEGIIDLQGLFHDIENEVIRIQYEVGRSSQRGKRPRLTFKLVFRARTTDELQAFHVKSDGKGPTLTVLHGLYNVLFGGYTSQNWSAGKKELKEDVHAFLFYKHENKNAQCLFFHIKYKHKDRAITCDSEFGPTFGGKQFKDYDLQTFNLAEKTKIVMKENYMRLNGKMNFGTAYKNREHQPGKSDINSGTMDVKSIEVYQVVDDTMEKMWRKKPTDDVIFNMRTKLLKCEPLAGFSEFRYNILLIGIMQAGKSSFFNTLASVIAGQCKYPAPASRAATSVTNAKQEYTLKTIDNRKLCVNIIDIRGYGPDRAYEHELEHLLNGELPYAYMFPETAAPISEDKLKKCPSIADEVHLVCFVVDSERLPLQKRKEYEDSLKNILETVQRKGLPITAVATKMDLICPSIEKDADNVYDSPKAHDGVLRVAEVLGLPEKNVFPIVNYINETELSPAKDRLAIHALYSMVQIAEDYLKSNLQAKKRQENVLMKTIQSDFKKIQLQDKTLKVLFVGAVNSGKSSVIDSIISTLTGNICNRAAGCSTRDDSKEESITERFQLYKWKPSNAAGTETKSNVIFGDMPGFQQSGGVELKHVKLIIKGKVKNKCKIKYGIDKKNKQYKTKPSVTDRMNCVCIVIDIASGVSPKTLEILKKLIDWLQTKGIPFVVILTKIDLLNQFDSKKTQTVDLYSRTPRTLPRQNDLNQIDQKKTQTVGMYSKLLRQTDLNQLDPKKTQTVEMCSRTLRQNDLRESTDEIVRQLGIKENMVFPVQNYVHETNVSSEIDVRLLNAFQKIVAIGRDKMDDDTDDDSDDSSDSDESEHDTGQERASTDENF